LCEQPGSQHFAFSFAGSFITGAPPVGVWGLDTQSTQNSGVGSWAPGEGFLALGSVRLQVKDPWRPSDRQVLFPRTTLNMKNLTGTEFAVHLYVESGQDAVANIFAQSSNFGWAAGPAVELPIGSWVCLSLNLDDPQFVDADFDITKVIRLGVELYREESSALTDDIVAYLDDFTY
jgi:hypothetical protein